MQDSKYQLSPFLRYVKEPSSNSTLVYHKLFGNPRILNAEGINFLNLFLKPQTLIAIVEQCDDDPRELLENFKQLSFLIIPGQDERLILVQNRSKYLLELASGRTVDRMGLAISDWCNLACKHCIHFQKDSETQEKITEYRRPLPGLNMTWETAKICIDGFIALLRDHNRNHCKIHFGNAEPLFNWQTIAKILHYCDSISDISFEFTINTNLTLLTSDIAHTLKKFKVRIATSLDGTKIANNAIRITNEGRGTFDAIVKNIDLLDHIGYPLDGFSITVAQNNFDSIGTDIIDWAANRQMTSIAFDYDLIGLHNVPTKEKVSKLMCLKKYADAIGINFFGTWDSAYRNLTSGNLLTETHTFCAAVQGKSLEFNTDGSIKVCSHTTSRIGHVNTFDKLFESNNNLSRLVKARYPGTDKVCIGCQIECACAGQCEVTREFSSKSGSFQDNKIFTSQCEFYREITDALIIEHLKSQELDTSTG
ncbi:MAG: radical SAM protein [Candidatus Taylorbacteria bacterium]